MKDNAVNSNKRSTQKPHWEPTSLVHVAGMGGICSVVVVIGETNCSTMVFISI